jgi:hypothetical protein
MAKEKEDWKNRAEELDISAHIGWRKEVGEIALKGLGHEIKFKYMDKNE